jgi:uncharacterized alpha-E superfamily protein
MLSRVAERVYWMGRYLERAESTARLVNAYTMQVMDLPKGVEPGWRHLVDIVGSSAEFDARYPRYDERSTIGFLVSDLDSSGSIMSAIAAARENVRTTRDVLPTEAWEYANELHLYARANLEQAVGRKHRFAALKNVIFRCQQIAGLLAGTMSHDTAYDFVRLGRNLERADMTTRIVDSAVFILMPRKDAPGEYDSILWVNVLRSLSAYQMYRQHVRNRVVGDEVVRFLLRDPQLPRAVRHALAQAAASLAALPRNVGALQSLARVQARIEQADTRALGLDEVHALLDRVQEELAVLHDEIRATWFGYAPVTQLQAQFQVQTA